MFVKFHLGELLGQSTVMVVGEGLLCLQLLMSHSVMYLKLLKKEILKKETNMIF